MALILIAQGFGEADQVLEVVLGQAATGIVAFDDFLQALGKVDPGGVLAEHLPELLFDEGAEVGDLDIFAEYVVEGAQVLPLNQNTHTKVV